MVLIDQMTQRSNDPEANSISKAFMKHLKKVSHTVITEDKGQKLKLNKQLRAFRATSHTTMGGAPGDLLYSINFHTKLPDIQSNREDYQQDILDVRRNDDDQKAILKKNKDKGRYVRPHGIQVGNKDLKEQKATKTQTNYDPKHYTVTKVQGRQIQAK